MSNVIYTIAGNGSQGYDGDGGKATLALMDNPFHVALNSDETELFIADCFNYCVRKVDLQTNIITTVAGNGNKGYSGDGKSAIDAEIEEIYAVQVAENGDLYILQRFSPAIRKVDFRTGIISTVAGNGTIGYSGDGGPAHLAQMREPNDMEFDGSGGLLIADIQDQRVRRLDIQTGLMSTFVGDGEKRHSGDGGHFSSASIFGARAVCADVFGNVYICEREGNAIRKIDENGIITLFAGTGEKGYSGDKGLATLATFNGPKAIRCDLEGNVLVVDTENHGIRKVDIGTGLIDTVAGGHLGPDGDSGTPNEAGLARPHGVISDSKGRIYIADSENHRVRCVY